MTRIGGHHHVLGIEHLDSELGNSQVTVPFISTAGQRSESRHEEVQTWERNHVNGQFPQIGIELTWEPETGGHSRHGCADQVVQLLVRRRGQLERSETNIVQGFIVDAEGFVGVLNELVDTEGCIVRFHDRVWYFGRREDGKCGHDPVRVLFTHLGQQQGSHSRSSSTAERVSQLESCSKWLVITGCIKSGRYLGESRCVRLPSEPLPSLHPQVRLLPCSDL